jgi:hypothetical protein
MMEMDNKHFHNQRATYDVCGVGITLPQRQGYPLLSQIR